MQCNRSLVRVEQFPYCCLISGSAMWRARSSYVYPRTLDSLSVASYDSQGYGGGILARLYAALPKHLHVCNVMRTLKVAGPVKDPY
jgi:hypothetical protein